MSNLKKSFQKLNRIVFKNGKNFRFSRWSSTSSQGSKHKIENQFGYEKINSGDKQEKVDNVFKSVADNYDMMNDAMSLGIHRVWKDIFVDRLTPTPGTKLLDVAGGTGDISFRFLRYLRNQSPKSFVTVSDINPKMLEVGRKRSEDLDYCKNNIEWVEANAEKLPFSDETYDAYTIAFGIRNVTHMEKVLDEAYRVLKPGGRFMCLEFSEVQNDYLKWVYDAYSFQVIPALGELIAGEWKAYQYLVESIRNFPNQAMFKQLIQNAGFRMVNYENLTFGVVAIHSGFKL
ncbi:2-hexaprenyl-6-methoxy-1,4-benzoquinone methyltransferase [Polyplax serrata]|uniref:2-methoxy-6-polyprenyl-1,4-benzoquinol methylase, mitochondrial n=1 Tax=Polyplax serrata TaxID=468196 RepID=A0ABR1BHA0_POLSC